MEQTKKPTEQSAAADTVESSKSSDLLYLIRAYNRREISFDEWMEQSRAWAEAIIQQHDRSQKR